MQINTFCFFSFSLSRLLKYKLKGLQNSTEHWESFEAMKRVSWFKRSPNSGRIFSVCVFYFFVKLIKQNVLCPRLCIGALEG